jgi:micrococcal nuclease
VLAAGSAGCTSTADDGATTAHGNRHSKRERRHHESRPHDTSPSGREGAPPRTKPARVTAVTDGDTIELSAIGKTRLIGIDTPEVYGSVECYGRAASNFTKSVLTPGRRVRYRLGIEERDRYGRALAYVWLTDGTFFNALIAERGFAAPLTIPPNDEYARVFLRAARRARRAGHGLWSSATCADENAPALRPPGAAGSGTTGCARFRTHAGAQRWWERAGRPYGLDGDGDGQVCEDLP